MESVSAIDPVQFLERAPMFRGIATSRVEALMKGCSQRWVKRGQIVYRKRALPNACYFLLSGKVKLFLLSAGGDERITDVILPGQFFGEVELFSRQPYLAFAEALQPSRYIVIGREITLHAPFFARAEAIAGGEPPAESRLEAALAAAR